jgi:hypothetical protein
MDSRTDPLLADMKEAPPESPESSDDEGGVKLEGYNDKPATPTQEKRVKQEKKNANVISESLQGHDKFGSSSKKRQREEEEHGSKPNPYLAHQDEKPTKKESDPKSNPYLAHMYEEEEVEEQDYNGYSNGYGRALNRTNGLSNASTLARFPRHKTTAAMAKKAEDGPNNPFSGKPLSSQYFNILRTRRTLPVHQQR